MKTLIVATDFSTEANNALKYAAALAQHIRARIILFNSYQLPEQTDPTEISKEEIDRQLQSNQEYLEDVAFKVSQQYNIPVDSWSNLTYVAEGLDELVQRSNAALVVMGMWKNAQEDSLFGNTTTFVISQASYPVLVVPDRLSFRRIGKILFSWDPGSRIDPSRLKLLKDFATGFDAQVQVFHVKQELELAGSSSGQEKMALEEFLQGVQYSFRNMEEEEVLEGIDRGIQEYGADLLVMVPHKPAYGEDFFYESSTREMALRTKVPLLTLPNVKNVE